MDSTSSPRVDIVIPIWNQPVLTRRCLESILRNTDLPIRLILVDNASGLKTRRYLERFEADPPVEVHRIRNEKNLGFIQAVNQGIRAGEAPWVCVLNNDTVVTTGWLTEMLKVAGQDSGIGLVNPTSNSLGFRPAKESLESYAARLKTESGTSELSTALGFCLLARRSLWESVGGLDESFGMGYFDDDDLSLKVKAAGYRCVRANAAYVFHEERASFRFLPNNRRAFDRNRRLFEQRWGRRLRILCDSLPKEVALQLAGEGHWLTVLNLNGGNWCLRAALRLLLKRKKPFHLVISQDPTWIRCVKSLRWFHRADLLTATTPQEILRECHRLSRSPS